MIHVFFAGTIYAQAQGLTVKNSGSGARFGGVVIDLV
jgi:hypothetical protein